MRISFSLCILKYTLNNVFTNYIIQLHNELSIAQCNDLFNCKLRIAFPFEFYYIYASILFIPLLSLAYDRQSESNNLLSAQPCMNVHNYNRDSCYFELFGLWKCLMHCLPILSVYLLCVPISPVSLFHPVSLFPLSPCLPISSLAFSLSLLPEPKVSGGTLFPCLLRHHRLQATANTDHNRTRLEA